MKFLYGIALLLGLLSTGASAQQSSSDPLAGTLVDCGSDKAVIFAETESKDGRYALGWTVRRRDPSAEPVHWNPQDTDSLLGYLQYDIYSSEARTAPYELINGVIDFRAKNFTPLATRYPREPHGSHQYGLLVEWLGNQKKTQFAFVHNDMGWHTENLWLVQLGVPGTHVCEVTAAVKKATRGFLRKRLPMNYQHYSVRYCVNEGSEEARRQPHSSEVSSLQIPFEAGIPKSADSIPYYVGSITLALPSKTVVGITAKDLRE